MTVSDQSIGIFDSGLGGLTVFREMERPDDCLGCFRRALEINPDLAPAHNALGDALLNLGLLDDAIEAYEKALDDLEKENINLMTLTLAMSAGDRQRQEVFAKFVKLLSFLKR